MDVIKRGLERLFVSMVTAGLDDEKPGTNPSLRAFLERCGELKGPRVLEVGTKRVEGNPSTRRDHWVPGASEYLGCDYEDGPDVDVVADIHRLSKDLGVESFDVIISCSTFEHIKYPHLAAHEIMKTLRVGGLLYIQTHQTYLIHAYPHDYFRFTTEGLAGLFGTKMGFRVVSTDYSYPARIYSKKEPHFCWGRAFLDTNLFGEKTARTPKDYVYELDF